MHILLHIGLLLKTQLTNLIVRSLSHPSVRPSVANIINHVSVASLSASRSLSLYRRDPIRQDFAYSCALQTISSLKQNVLIFNAVFLYFIARAATRFWPTVLTVALMVRFVFRLSSVVCN